MTYEHSLNFIKDYDFVINGNDTAKVKFLTSDITLEDHPEAEEDFKSATKIKEVSEFFQSIKAKRNEYNYLSLSASSDNGRVLFTTALQSLLWMDLVSFKLSRRTAFLRIHGKLRTVSGSGGDPETSPLDHRRKLDTRDDEWTKGMDAELKFSSVAAQVTPQSVLSCTVSLDVCWGEPVENPQICAHRFLEKLLEDESTKDLTIISGNGMEFTCHSNIISAHSPPLSKMISVTTGMKEAMSRRIEMRENSEEGIRLLINYFYGREMPVDEISTDVTVELFQTAHKYELSQLERSLAKFFLIKRKERFSADVILELYLFARNVDTGIVIKVRDHCIDLMSSMDIQELKSCSVFKKLAPVESTNLSLKLVEHLQMQLKLPKSSTPQNTGKGVKRKRQK